MTQELATTGVPEVPLVTLGDIMFSTSWIVTPSGTRPIAGTQIFVTDYSRTESRIPGWAITLAVVGALFFLVGLLFLLVRETKTTGYVQVSVHNGTLAYATQVPAYSPLVAQDMNARANYARQLIANAH